MRNKRGKHYQPKFVFIFLIILCIAGIAGSAYFGTTGNSAAGSLLAPMQQGINTIGGFFSRIGEKHKTISELEAENESLKAEVDSLNAQLSSYRENISEYDELLKQLDIKSKYPDYSMTGARVIGKEAGNWYKMFTIDKGTNDGIETDMNVISENGLVGIVVKTGPDSSVVRSIIDSSSSVSAMIGKNYDNCIVNGDLVLADSGLLAVEFLSKDSQVAVGDEILTSYISDKYLPGILIGYISKVNADENELTYTAELTPAADLEHLSTVMVVLDKKGVSK
ncbi:MAG: rod shape-determining protein MreC [Lachnospiraceae bacterium]|nr:rod shape-determining protein MreC [Lachnospiraceae bacterium]